MRLWSQAYSRGEVPVAVRERWATVVGCPFRKEKADGSADVRPILIGEPLASIPGAALYQLHAKRILQLILESDQHALSAPGGAPGHGCAGEG